MHFWTGDRDAVGAADEGPEAEVDTVAVLLTDWGAAAAETMATRAERAMLVVNFIVSVIEQVCLVQLSALKSEGMGSSNLTSSSSSSDELTGMGNAE